LLIDDEPEAVGALLAAMRGHGWRVSLATDAVQGCRRAELLAPDLILLDVRMPDMDGFAVCRRLRESPRTSGIPIVFLTTADAPEERLGGLTVGAVDYILKTCMPAELLARVQIHLELARRAGTGAAPAEPRTDTDEVTLRAAQRLIGDKLAALPSLQAIALQVGVTEKRLSEIFRRRLGATVFAWVREERLRRAREKLADSGMDIQTIASAVGFRSAANFATAFRERYGVTPSRYRDELRAGRTGACDGVP
jgi:DNA-binding response OmpR family regulator